LLMLQIGGMSCAVCTGRVEAADQCRLISLRFTSLGALALEATKKFHKAADDVYGQLDEFASLLLGKGPLASCDNPTCRAGAVDVLKRCSRCLDVRYCSKECQVAHWKVHKQSRSKIDGAASSEAKHVSSDCVESVSAVDDEKSGADEKAMLANFKQLITKRLENPDDPDCRQLDTDASNRGLQASGNPTPAPVNAATGVPTIMTPVAVSVPTASTSTNTARHQLLRLS
jgi:hypothetical protein